MPASAEDAERSQILSTVAVILTTKLLYALLYDSTTFSR